MENLERLTGRTVLVTGGTGFIGSHLAERLVGLGARVVVTVRSHDPFSYFHQEKLDRKTIQVTCDLKDHARVLDVVSRYETEFIFHLAAQAIVPTAYEHPAETLESNVMGTVHILEAARRFSHVHGVVVASSDKSYGKSAKQYEETDALRGDHPYEVSKSCADLIALAYAKTYSLPVAVTRCGNIYGAGDLNYSRIIPGIMKSIIEKQPLVLRSDGTFVRDYLYVEDAVGAYIHLMTHISRAKGEAFNVSSQDSRSVLDVLDGAKRILKRDVPYTIGNTAKNEIPYQHLDDAKIRALGWKPVHTLKTGLPPTYRWYKAHLS